VRSVRFEIWIRLQAQEVAEVLRAAVRNPGRRPEARRLVRDLEVSLAEMSPVAYEIFLMGLAESLGQDGAQEVAVVFPRRSYSGLYDDLCFLC